MRLLIIIIIYSRAKEACESADYNYIQSPPPLAKEGCESVVNYDLYNYYIQSCQGGL